MWLPESIWLLCLWMLGASPPHRKWQILVAEDSNTETLLHVKIWRALIYFMIISAKVARDTEFRWPIINLKLMDFFYITLMKIFTSAIRISEYRSNCWKRSTYRDGKNTCHIHCIFCLIGFTHWCFHRCLNHGAG